MTKAEWLAMTQDQRLAAMDRLRRANRRWMLLILTLSVILACVVGFGQLRKRFTTPDEAMRWLNERLHPPPKVRYWTNNYFPIGNVNVYYHTLGRPESRLLVFSRYDRIGWESGETWEDGSWRRSFGTVTGQRRDDGQIDLLYDPAQRTDRVQINGETFDLSHGQVFLLTVRGGKGEVVQLNRTLSDYGVNREQDTIVRFATNDPDISRFITEGQERPELFAGDR